ncbi:helix-turn-helix transcriptional regulator [Crocosphaera sp. XPORK-15E]|uniref:helix-turn-helix domain-containing protein n=1 Tax=Crocosphaera sp. XPORK-15E TaxID=3110247 RepID=UPI002B21DF66|nr:helix-turn-helix transcriptional regulator [Crocosphaera sp. XPORK-15E]MEA5533161.1 helix-turn-helix transcriptional regulator [Crocosphaera sp. XPORK-15E]
MEQHQKADKLQKNFGQVIRNRRLALGISQENLAENCDLHRNYISEIERGIKSPSLKTITLLAIALGCLPHILLQEAEELLNDDTFTS